MRVSLDGGQTYVEAPEGVRVIYDVEHEDQSAELHVNLTDEGFIMDLWATEQTAEVSSLRNLATSSQTLDECVAQMIEDNAHVKVQETLISALDAFNVPAQQAAMFLNLHPDRLNNGGMREVIEIATEEDDLDWIVDRIADYLAKHGRKLPDDLRALQSPA